MKIMNQIHFGSNIFINNFDFNILGQTDKNNEEEQMSKIHILERYNMKLCLRKKKVNEKILNQRKIDIQKNNEIKNINLYNSFSLNNSFKKLISKLELEYNDEKKIIELLIQISCIFESKYKSINTEVIQNTLKFNSVDLINNNWIETIYKIILNYLKSQKIILYISRILFISCLIIYNDLQNDNENKSFNYFISSDKYIHVYNKLLDFYLKDDCQISYNMIIFIGFILKLHKKNQISLFLGGTLKYILDSFDLENDSKKLLQEKIWCLSQFKIDKIYELNIDFALKVQKIILNAFFNHQKIELFYFFNKDIGENNVLYNFLKLIENTTHCKQNIFLEKMIKSDILKFLMDNLINKDIQFIYIIVNILINISDVEPEIGQNLIKIGIIRFLLKIISDKSKPLDLREASFIPINNLFSDIQLWNIVLFEQKVLQEYCILLKDKDIEPDIFSEICYLFYQSLYFCNDNDLNIILDEYHLIQLICKALKQIIISSKIEKKICFCYTHFCCLILSLILNNEENLIKKIVDDFQKSSGEEILDFILCTYSNINLENRNLSDKEDIINILNMVKEIKKELIL